MNSKKYWNWIVDVFEANVYENISDNFDKRASVTAKGGRPYLYSPYEICDRMVIYFRNCANNDMPFMITGLCLSIGISREWFRKLEKSSNDQFVDAIKKGKQMIEFYWETQGQLMHNPAWAIFILKNMGWSDRAKTENKTSIEISNEKRIEALERIKNFSEI